MTVRNALAAAAFGAGLVALLLQPTTPVAFAQSGSGERVAAAPLPDDGVHATVTVQPIGNAPMEVTVDLYEGGTLTEPIEAEIPRNGNLVITDTVEADGFVARAADDFAVMVRWSENPDGTGLGGAYPVATAPEFGPTYTPFVAPAELGPISGTLQVINAGDTKEFGDTYTYVEGKRSLTFHGSELAPGEVAAATLEELPDIEASVRSALFETYSSGSPAHHAVLRVNSAAADSYTLPTLPPPGEETLYIPPIEKDEPSLTTCFVANRALRSQSAAVTSFDAGGEPLDNAALELRPGELEVVPSTGAPLRIEADSNLIGAGCVERYDDDSIEDPGVSTVTVRHPGPAATHRAKLFGAPASGVSRVAVGIYNPGSRQLKARVILRDGDGEIAMARTIRARAGHTNFLNYRPRAFGPDTWAEVKIRGDREGVPFLVQVDRPTGDVTYYPATVLH